MRNTRTKLLIDGLFFQVVRELKNNDSRLDMNNDSRFITNSFQVPNAVIDELMAELSGAELKCYLAILRKTKGWNKDFDAVSVTQLMSVTGLSNRAVIDACNHLVELNLLYQKTGSRGVKIFSVNLCNNFTSEKSSLVKKVHGTSEKSSLVTSEKSSHTKNNIKNTTQNTIKKTTQKSESEVLLERFGITGQLAKDFIAHRKTKRGAISETQLSRLQKQADKAGISICEAVEICIERNWQGFNASWDWRDEKLRTSQAQKMSFEEKNALPWNRPEDWENVL